MTKSFTWHCIKMNFPYIPLFTKTFIFIFWISSINNKFVCISIIWRWWTFVFVPNNTISYIKVLYKYRIQKRIWCCAEPDWPSIEESKPDGRYREIGRARIRSRSRWQRPTVHLRQKPPISCYFRPQRFQQFANRSYRQVILSTVSFSP